MSEFLEQRGACESLLNDIAFSQPYINVLLCSWHTHVVFRHLPCRLVVNFRAFSNNRHVSAALLEKEVASSMHRLTVFVDILAGNTPDRPCSLV
jgi:hypothetical protein